MSGWRRGAHSDDGPEWIDLDAARSWTESVEGVDRTAPGADLGDTAERDTSSDRSTSGDPGTGRDTAGASGTQRRSEGDDDRVVSGADRFSVRRPGRARLWLGLVSLVVVAFIGVGLLLGDRDTASDAADTDTATADVDADGPSSAGVDTNPSSGTLDADGNPSDGALDPTAAGEIAAATAAGEIAAATAAGLIAAATAAGDIAALGPDVPTSPALPGTDSYRIEAQPPGTWIPGLVNPLGVPASGEVPDPNLLSKSFPLIWDDGSIVIAEVPTDLAPSNAVVATLINGDLRMRGLRDPNGLEVTVGIGRCPDEVASAARINSGGMLVVRTSDQAATACRPEQHLVLEVEVDGALTDAHLSVLDVVLVDVRGVTGDRYLDVASIDAPAVPGRFRPIGPLAVPAVDGITRNAVAGGYGTPFVEALDQTGDRVWSRPVDGVATSSFLLGAAELATVDDGHSGAWVFAASAEGAVVAIDGVSGQTTWSFDLGGGELADQLIADRDGRHGLLLTRSARGTIAPRVLKLDLLDGSVVWELGGMVQTRWQWSAPIPVDRDGRDVLLMFDAASGSASTSVWAVDAATGAVLWRTDLGTSHVGHGHLSPSVAVLDESTDVLTVLTMGTDGEILGLDPGTGAVIWRAAVRGSLVQPVEPGVVRVGIRTQTMTGALTDGLLVATGDGTAVAIGGADVDSAVDQLRRAVVQNAERRENCVTGFNRRLAEGRNPLSPGASWWVVESLPVLDGGNTLCVYTRVHEGVRASTCDRIAEIDETQRVERNVNCRLQLGVRAALRHPATGDGRILLDPRGDVGSATSSSVFFDPLAPDAVAVAGGVEVQVCGIARDLVCGFAAGLSEATSLVSEQSLSQTDGALLWQRDISGAGGRNQVYGVLGNRVIVGAPGAAVGSIDPSTGDAEWSVDLRTDEFLTAIAFDSASETIIAVVEGSDGTRVLGVDVTGGRTWSTTQPASARIRLHTGGGVVVGEAKVAFGEIGQIRRTEFFRIEPSTGEELWRWSLPMIAFAGEPVAHLELGRGLILVVETRQETETVVTRLDAATGTALLRTQLPGDVVSPDAFVERFFVGTTTVRARDAGVSHIVEIG